MKSFSLINSPGNAMRLVGILIVAGVSLALMTGCTPKSPPDVPHRLPPPPPYRGI